MLLMLPFEEQGARMLWTPVWSRVSSSARSPCWASPSTQPWCSPSDCRPWLQGKRKGAEAIVSSRTPGWVVSSPFPHPIPHFSQRPRLQTIWRGRQGWTTAKHCTESWGQTCCWHASQFSWGTGLLGCHSRSGCYDIPASPRVLFLT